MFNEALVTILSTFVGAWLAYKWGERTQKGIEQRACKAEIKKDRENKTWQLNYLNTFLYTHITAFIALFQLLQGRLNILEKFLQGTQISESECYYLLSPIAEYELDFPLNTNELLFAADDEAFIKGIVFTKTSLANYYNEIQMLNNSLLELQPFAMSKQLKTEHIHIFQEKMKYVLAGISFTICTFNKTLKIVKDYNDKHDKLPLNKIKEFTQEELQSIELADNIRRNTYNHLKHQQTTYAK